jgi:hypothetical protein
MVPREPRSHSRPRPADAIASHAAFLRDPRDVTDQDVATAVALRVGAPFARAQ